MNIFCSQTLPRIWQYIGCARFEVLHVECINDCYSSVRCTVNWIRQVSLQWRHNGRDSVSNHQPQECLLNRVFRRRSKKRSKLRVICLCEGNFPHKGPVTQKMFPFDDVIVCTWRCRHKEIHLSSFPHLFKLNSIIGHPNKYYAQNTGFEKPKLFWNHKR